MKIIVEYPDGRKETYYFITGDILKLFKGREYNIELTYGQQETWWGVLQHIFYIKLINYEKTKK